MVIEAMSAFLAKIDELDVPASDASLGVLGGLGPLASAAFVATVYEESVEVGIVEQQLPSLVLYSDPNFPDRTTALMRGEVADLAHATTRALVQLANAGATHFLICCFTLHAALDLVRPDLRRRVLSLPDLALAQLATVNGPALLLGTTGSRRLRVFERAAMWSEISDRVVYLNDDDQASLHAALYELKAGGDPRVAATKIEGLCERYEVDTWIAGCTELHLVSRIAREREWPNVVDPLTALARALRPARMADRT